MGLLNLLPREEQYFSLFIQMTVYISDAARELKEMLADKNRDYGEYAQRIKGLEHACDELTHSVSTRLNKSFITPFDREDIYMMSTALDDIVDLIDDAARAIIIFDVREIKDYAHDMADVIVRMAEQLRAIVLYPPEAKKHHAASCGDSSAGKSKPTTSFTPPSPSSS
jgi:uncharacterized protein Yka (UPF0111/DUF47 family)